jgi:hypothetical protein
LASTIIAPAPIRRSPKTGAGRDAGVAVVGGVALGEEFRVFEFTAQEHLVPWHEHLVEHAHRGGLAVLVAEDSLVGAGSAGGSRDDGEALGVDGHRAGDGEVAIGRGHGPPRQHQQFVHVGRRGDDGLGARDHDAIRAPCDHVHVGIGVVLLMGTQAAIALGIGHGDADRQVFVLHALEVGAQARVVFTAYRVIEAVRQLPRGVQAVHRQVTHRTAGFLAGEAREFELGEQVVAVAIQGDEAIDLPGARGVGRECDGGVGRVERVVIGHADGVDAGREARLVGHRSDGVAIDEHARLVAAQ